MMSAAKDYGVEVVVAYETKRVGQVIFPPGVLRQRLIQTGRVRAVVAPKEEVTPAPVKSSNQNKPTLKIR